MCFILFACTGFCGLAGLFVPFGLARPGGGVLCCSACFPLFVVEAPAGGAGLARFSESPRQLALARVAAVPPKADAGP